MPRSRAIVLIACLLPLAACDQIAVLDGTKAREADAFAVGSACRQSGRALEDCFVMYPDSPKAQVFSGWKEMNDYMTANKIDAVSPTLIKAESGNAVKGEEKSEKSVKVEKFPGRAQALPPTSAAAADPLAGLTKPLAAGQAASNLEKIGAKPAEGAPPKH